MDTNLNPKISIITTTRNRATFISKAIESVLNQSLTYWELIILDDDSNDTTETIVASYITKDSRIKYHKNSPLLGISANRNKGLKLAVGKYITVLDSDDFWEDKNKLQKQYDFLEQNRGYVLIGSNIRIIDEKGNQIKNSCFAAEDTDIRKKILSDNQVPHSSVMIRKESIAKVGNYNEKLSCVEDLDLFLKLGKLGKMKNLSEITTAYTRHSEGVSQKRKVTMAWNHYKIVLRNFGQYPNSFSALVRAKLRLIKSLF
jgi:glycosyltransferase involved in cell wall biosynthesis